MITLYDDHVIKLDSGPRMVFRFQSFAFSTNSSNSGGGTVFRSSNPKFSMNPRSKFSMRNSKSENSPTPPHPTLDLRHMVSIWDKNFFWGKEYVLPVESFALQMVFYTLRVWRPKTFNTKFCTTSYNIANTQYSCELNHTLHTEYGTVNFKRITR